jgi:hypothetical protein
MYKTNNSVVNKDTLVQIGNNSAVSSQDVVISRRDEINTGNSPVKNTALKPRAVTGGNKAPAKKKLTPIVNMLKEAINKGSEENILVIVQALKDFFSDVIIPHILSNVVSIMWKLGEIKLPAILVELLCSELMHVVLTDGAESWCATEYAVRAFIGSDIAVSSEKGVSGVPEGLKRILTADRNFDSKDVDDIAYEFGLGEDDNKVQVLKDIIKNERTSA